MNTLLTTANRATRWLAARPVALDEDRELVWRSKRGDPDAFAALVERHQTAIYNLLLRMTRDPEEATDLAQETFLRAWRGLPAFREEARFSTWLYRIAYNVCLNRRLVERTTVLEPDLAERLVGPAAEQPEAVFARQALRAELQALIDQLPAAYRLVLHLFYWADLSYEEISQILNLPLGTVKTHLHRARAALRQALAAQGASDHALS